MATRFPLDEVPAVFDQPGVATVRQAEIGGGMTLEFSCLGKGLDVGPLFRGLPDDMCQCPHWGYVLRGSMTFRTRDGAITVRAGDAYYVPPGHVPLTTDEECEVIELSPTAELRQTMDQIARNMEAAGASA
jgi:hypothetical protein